MKSEAEDKAKECQMPKMSISRRVGGRRRNRLKQRSWQNKRSEKVIEFEDKVDGRWTDTGNKGGGERREGGGREGNEKDERRQMGSPQANGGGMRE